MSKSIAVSQQKLHDDVQDAVKSLLNVAPTSLKSSDYGQVLTSTLAATQKVVTIQIADGDLKQLKNSKYKLCFAKKVGTADYNVVWQSYDAYLSNSEFSWTPQYQLFATNVFKDNVQVKVATNIVNIGLGQTSTLDNSGLLSPATTGGPAESFTFVNNYAPIRPGVNQLSTGIDGEQISTPIYVAVDQVVTGNTTLTPKESILVWFEQDVETSTMFSSSRSKAIEIDLTLSNSQARLYEGGEWKTI